MCVLRAEMDRHMQTGFNVLDDVGSKRADKATSRIKDVSPATTLFLLPFSMTTAKRLIYLVRRNIKYDKHTSILSFR